MLTIQGSIRPMVIAEIVLYRYVIDFGITNTLKFLFNYVFFLTVCVTAQRKSSVLNVDEFTHR